MRHLALAACLLSVANLAAAQSDAGLTLTTNPGVIVIVVEAPPLVITAPTIPPEFTFTINLPPQPRVDLGAMVNAASRPDAMAPVVIPPPPGTMLLGNAPIVTIEEEGVRMPDEQFSLP